MRTRSRWTRRGLTAAALLVGVALAWGAWSLGSRERGVGARATLSAVQALSGAGTAGYARAVAPRPFRWPEDHGPHPGYRTEWWYVTGNLTSSAGRRFGVQLTFFRSAVAPRLPDRSSVWNTNQVWLAHAALTDVESERHLASERIARGAAGLAGGRVDPFRVWVDEWEIRRPLEDGGMGTPGGPGDRAPSGEATAIFPLELDVATDDWTASLTLESAKPPVLQGDRGWSRKGPEPGNASYYYSFTRMPTRGSIEVDERVFEVEGFTWMDREWSTSALGAELEGWDWFSLQLSDERELMFFELRRRDGTSDPFDHGVLVEPEGSSRPLGPDDVRVEVLERWTSPIDGARYPSAWRLLAPELGLDLLVRPLLQDQEMDLTFRYWEGAVSVSGAGVEGPVQGSGYVELTGYAETPTGLIR